MNLIISSHHLEVTPTMHEYICRKLDHVLRHVDNAIDVNMTLSAENWVQNYGVTVHLYGKDIHVAAHGSEIYPTIDALMDKLEHQIEKHKEQRFARRTVVRH